ncbi:MAG TPA: type IV toxin-antitoxin system AbiEi family antitoxin domain-containing protein [Kofleriaceae bacterium]|jgi:predicted transcriptional regulator of viral defense system
MTPPRKSRRQSPWQALFALAAIQQGLVTTDQAKSAGVSPQLLAKYLAGGRIERVARALYRVVDFPPGDTEDLMGIWLWSKQQCVFSHETALMLHHLSDALPAKHYISLPASWRNRKLKVPPNATAIYQDVPERDREWIGGVPVTDVRRSLSDCFVDHASVEFVADASAGAAERGLIPASEVVPLSALAFWRERLSHDDSHVHVSQRLQARARRSAPPRAADR